MHKVTQNIWRFSVYAISQYPEKLNEQNIPKKADNSRWNETGSSRAAVEHLDYCGYWHLYFCTQYKPNFWSMARSTLRKNRNHHYLESLVNKKEKERSDKGMYSRACSIFYLSPPYTSSFSGWALAKSRSSNDADFNYWRAIRLTCVSV